MGADDYAVYSNAEQKSLVPQGSIAIAIPEMRLMKMNWNGKVVVKRVRANGPFRSKDSTVTRRSPRLFGRVVSATVIDAYPVSVVVEFSVHFWNLMA